MGSIGTPSFYGLWAATATANLADGVILFALPLVAISTGVGPGGVAAITAAATLAWPFAGLHAGWLVDQVDHRRLLLAANLVRVLVVGAAAGLLAADRLSLVIVVVVALVHGVTETLVDTALTTVVPTVTAYADRTRANARIETTINVANQFLGPPLAGFLASVGLAWAVGTGAALYAATIVGIAMMALYWRDSPSHTDSPPSRSTDTRVRAGLVALWAHPKLRALTLLTAGMNVAWAAWGSIFVVYAVAPGPLDLSPQEFGWALTASAAGGLVASMLVDPLRRRLGVRNLLLVDCVGTVTLVAPAAFGLGITPNIAGMVVAAAGSSIWRILVTTIRQNVTPPHLLGRVYAASRVISWGVIPVAAAATGVVAELTSIRTAFLAATVIAVAVLIAFVVLAARHDLESAFTAPDDRDGTPAGESATAMESPA